MHKITHARPTAKREHHTERKPSNPRGEIRSSLYSCHCHHFAVVVIVIIVDSFSSVRLYSQPSHEKRVSKCPSIHPSSPPNTHIPSALTKPHLILTHKHTSTNQPSPTASSSTLALTPLPRARNAPHASIPRRPSRNTSRSSRSGSIRARSARTSPRNFPLSHSPHRSSSIRSAAVGLAGTAVPSASAESLLQSSDALAEGVVLGFDELHLAPVGGRVGVVLHGDLDVWAWALGGCGRGLRAVEWRAGCCCC